MINVIIWKTKLERMVAVKSISVLLVLSAATMIFVKERWIALAGLIIGSLLSYYKFHALIGMIKELVSNSNEQRKKVLTQFILGWLLLILVFVAAISYKLWLFFGISGGTLLVPLTLTVFGAIGRLNAELTSID